MNLGSVSPEINSLPRRETVLLLQRKPQRCLCRRSKKKKSLFYKLPGWGRGSLAGAFRSPQTWEGWRLCLAARARPAPPEVRCGEAVELGAGSWEQGSFCAAFCSLRAGRGLRGGGWGGHSSPFPAVRPPRVGPRCRPFLQGAVGQAVAVGSWEGRGSSESFCFWFFRNYLIKRFKGAAVWVPGAPPVVAVSAPAPAPPAAPAGRGAAPRAVGGGQQPHPSLPKPFGQVLNARAELGSGGSACPVPAQAAPACPGLGAGANGAQAPPPGASDLGAAGPCPEPVGWVLPGCASCWGPAGLCPPPAPL